MKCILCNQDLKYTDVGWLCEEGVPIPHLYSIGTVRSDNIDTWFLEIRDYNGSIIGIIGVGRNYSSTQPTIVSPYYYIALDGSKPKEITPFYKERAANILNRYINLIAFS